MVGEDEAAAWVALRLASGVGDVAGRKLLAAFGTPLAALAADAAALARAGIAPTVGDGVRRASLDDGRAEVRRVAAAGARIVPCDDPEYPALLRHVPDAPLYLVARGERLVDGPTMAIVGARHGSRYGRDVARRLAEELAQAGVTVVSGLARGIDGAELAARIAETGTLLSERTVGAEPLPAHFPARNRIIAGMAHGTVVVEAAEGSGSLITARLARDQNREVFAVPGRIDSPLSAGTHGLIQQGAKLVASLDDVVSEIAPALRARAGDALSGGRAAPGEDDDLLPLLAGGPLGIDEIIRETRLPA